MGRFDFLYKMDLYHRAVAVYTTIPLWFYPDWLNKISFFLPFRYVTFEPINFFLGKTAIMDAWIPLLTAFLWLAGLSLLDRLVWQAAVKKLAVNGG